jgi:DNA-binding NarL/FixJ family response regulator
LSNQNEKILIFEDDTITGNYIKQFLENNNYQVVGLYNSGDKLFEHIESKEPDLILMDIKLKGNIDGIEIVNLLQDKYDIPVIYLTAYSDDLTVEKAKLTEPAGYLTKPIRERELLISIKMSLYNYRMNKLGNRNRKTIKKPSESRKQDILYISSKIIGDRGVDNLSIVKIAKELNISSPAIYKHFKSKSQLINYLNDELKRLFERYYQKIIHISNNGISKLNDLIIEWCEEFEKRNPIMNIIFSRLNYKGEDRLSETVRDIQEKNLKLVSDILNNLKEKSMIIGDDTDKNAKILIFSISDTFNEWENNDNNINLYNKINMIKEQVSKLLNIDY